MKNQTNSVSTGLKLRQIEESHSGQKTMIKRLANIKYTSNICANGTNTIQNNNNRNGPIYSFESQT